MDYMRSQGLDVVDWDEYRARTGNGAPGADVLFCGSGCARGWHGSHCRARSMHVPCRIRRLHVASMSSVADAIDVGIYLSGFKPTK